MAGSLLGWLIGRLGSAPGDDGGLGPFSGGGLQHDLDGGGIRCGFASSFTFMQYLRVLVVAVTVSVVGRSWMDTSDKAMPETIWFPLIHWLPFVATMAIAIGGGDPLASCHASRLGCCSGR